MSKKLLEWCRELKHNNVKQVSRSHPGIKHFHEIINIESRFFCQRRDLRHSLPQYWIVLHAPFTLPRLWAIRGKYQIGKPFARAVVAAPSLALLNNVAKQLLLAQNYRPCRSLSQSVATRSRHHG
jgi:hypothetical protein